jgi:hypothetical protein
MTKSKAYFLYPVGSASGQPQLGIVPICPDPLRTPRGWSETVQIKGTASNQGKLFRLGDVVFLRVWRLGLEAGRQMCRKLRGLFVDVGRPGHVRLPPGTPHSSVPRDPTRLRLRETLRIPVSASQSPWRGLHRRRRASCRYIWQLVVVLVSVRIRSLQALYPYRFFL